MKSLREIFPRASGSFLAANPPLSPAEPDKSVSSRSVGPAKAKRGVMNNTESQFALILERQKRAGEILRYLYEGITLRWNGIKYTPDFVVFEYEDNELPMDQRRRGGIKLIEVKGAFTGGKFERAIERFRHAKTYWPEFTFEMHQKTKAGWKRIH